MDKQNEQQQTKETVPLKAAWQVVAGLVPGTPIDEFSRSWFWTSADQEKLSAGDKDARFKWIRYSGESREYAAAIADPRSVNWVRHEFIWF